MNSMKETIDKNECLFRKVKKILTFGKMSRGDQRQLYLKIQKVYLWIEMVEEMSKKLSRPLLNALGRALVSVDASFCMDIGTHLVYAPLQDNEYHAEIHDSLDKVTLHPKKAKKLANHCSLVAFFD
ncbi:hypothetical protein RZN25_05620 [Bacillaceae bacterium S4-13-56]